jgi:anti-sigma regulatory factor (Ser/Thr protein kinase)/Fe-S-cluster-containing hydrogenase component 2
MITGSYPIAGGDFLAAGSASRTLKEQLKRLGVDGQIMRRIMIAAYEAEMNVVLHAVKGNLWVRFDHERFNMEVVDEGPGITDLTLAMRPGYSTASARARELGFGAGMGLPNIRKASDLFEVDSQVGKGTRVRSTIYLKSQPAVEQAGVCLTVDPALCNGCLDCLKACPTRALRVWNLEPNILPALCIECTACIAACKRGVFGIRKAEPEKPPGEPVAATARHTLIIPRAFLTQFGTKFPPRLVLAALRSLGFKDIRFTEEWEEQLRRTVRLYAAEQEIRPLISPICPAVVRLVESQFPSLIAQIAPFMTPIESAVEAYGLQPATFVAACPSQYTLLEQAGLSGRLQVLSPAELSARILPLLAAGNRTAESRQKPSSRLPRTGGQELAVLEAWGLKDVIDVLEKTEKGLAGDFQVLELSCCVYGCYGTPLFEENPFMAGKRWSASRLGRRRQVSIAPAKRAYLARSGTRLDRDMGKAIEKLTRIDRIASSLPGRDCGACGAPTCSSLAEDIVLERSSGLECPVLRARGES